MYRAILYRNGSNLEFCCQPKPQQTIGFQNRFVLLFCVVLGSAKVKSGFVSLLFVFDYLQAASFLCSLTCRAHLQSWRMEAEIETSYLCVDSHQHWLPGSCLSNGKKEVPQAVLWSGVHSSHFFHLINLFHCFTTTFSIKHVFNGPNHQIRVLPSQSHLPLCMTGCIGPLNQTLPEVD